MTKTIIHIGAAKAGSTFLQRYFEKHPDIFYNRNNVGRFNQNGKLVLEHLNKQSNLPIKMISAEKFSFPIFSHNWQSGIIEKANPTKVSDTQKEIAEQLFRWFPDAKILFITRNHETIIPSVYTQYVASGGVLSYEEFVNEYKHGLTQAFDYDFIYKTYSELFGKENVTVLPFELLKEDQNEFLMQMERSLDIPYLDFPIKVVNKSLSQKYVKLYITVSKCFYVCISIFPHFIQKHLTLLYILFLESRPMTWVKDRFFSK